MQSPKSHIGVQTAAKMRAAAQQIGCMRELSARAQRRDPRNSNEAAEPAAAKRGTADETRKQKGRQEAGLFSI
jgi:hypothetical protein